VRKEVAPPPAPPRDADIALERERERQAREKLERDRAEKAAQEKARKEKAERDKAERDKADKLARAQAEKTKADKAERERRAREEKEAKEAQAEAERVARQREDNLRRLMAQAGQAASAAGVRGTAAADAAPSANYRGLLVRAIKPNIVFTASLPGNPAAEVEVRAAPGGTILGAKLVKSSGHKEWDDAVVRAIERTASLPRDVDGRVPATLVISFRPRD
jgi:colicin import membrane protein